MKLFNCVYIIYQATDQVEGKLNSNHLQIEEKTRLFLVRQPAWENENWIQTSFEYQGKLGYLVSKPGWEKENWIQTSFK